MTNDEIKEYKPLSKPLFWSIYDSEHEGGEHEGDEIDKNKDIQING